MEAERTRRELLKRELWPLIRLAVPVALAELAWMGMGVVDTWMLGRRGPESLGGLAVGRVLFMNFGVAGSGLLAGLDATVSQAYGAGDRAECLRQKTQGLWLSVALGALLLVAYYAFLPWIRVFGVQPGVLVETTGYMEAIGWGLIPLLVYQTYRRFLQGTGRVQAVMWALVSANLVNVFLNAALIFGKWGFPELGTAGAGWATAGATTYMALFLGIDAHRLRRTEAWRSSRVRSRFHPRRAWTLLRLGVPASVQITLEVLLFSVSAIWIARLDSAQIAAHQIALVLASMTYMVPLGISAAAAVRVGQSLGAGRPRGARAAGWVAMGLSAAFMCCAAFAFTVFPRPLVRAFTDAPAVIEVGVPILWMCAAFQLFDGLGVTGIGALRGSGETFWPMVWTLIGYWGFAMPMGAWWTFGLGWGAVGLWGALSVGLILVSSLILVVWIRRSARFETISRLSPG